MKHLVKINPEITQKDRIIEKQFINHIILFMLFIITIFRRNRVKGNID